MKKCRYCEEDLDESNFTKDRSQPDSLSRGCRPCSAAVALEHRRRVKFHRKSRMKKDVSPLVKRIRMRAWISANPKEALSKYNNFIECRPDLAKENGWEIREFV